MALDLPSYLLGKKKGGGGGGTSDYSQLTNKPSINGVTLSGNKTGADLGLLSGDYDLRVLSVRNTPTQKDLEEASDIINYLYNIYTNNGQITNNLLIYVSFISTTTDGEIYTASLFITKYPDRFYVVNKNTELEFKGQPVGYPYSANTSDFLTTRKIKVTGTWTNNVFTATGITGLTESNYYGAFLATNNTKSYTPTSNYHPATKFYCDTIANPVVTTSSTSTYTIASLVGNQTYKLGEITSLTITATTTFDKESVIYFESGSTATSISIPDSITNLGDAPTLTTASNVNTGTCDANKKYIIAILNNIAVWKKY